MKKLIATLLVSAMVVGCLSGCGGKKETDVEQQAASKDYVYKQENVEFSGNGTTPSMLIQLGDKLYGYCYQWESDGVDATAEDEAADEETTVADTTTDTESADTDSNASTEDTDTESESADTETTEGDAEELISSEFSSIYFYEILSDGTFGEAHVMKGSSNQSISSLTADSEGNLFCICYEYPQGDDLGDTTSENYYLQQVTVDSEILLQVSLTEVPIIQQLTEEQGWFNVNNLFAEDDALYISCNGHLLKFDKSGNYVEDVVKQDSEGAMDSGNIIRGKENKYAIFCYGESSFKIYPLDLTSGTVGTATEIPGTGYEYNFYPGEKYDFLVSDNSCVYGYNLGDAEFTKILNYLDSDMDVWRIDSIVPVSETEFYGAYSCVSGTGSGIAKFTKVDPADVKDRQVITLGMVGSDWRIKGQAIQFNKTNDEYKISLISYTSDSGDYSEGVTKLNTDIASGNVPDIVLLDDSMPIDSYISKGLFEDLLPLIEKDEEIEKDDLMPNVIEALSTNGKLYQITPSYYIRTLVAKTADVGEDRGWTMDEAMQIWDSKGEGVEFLTGMSRSELLEVYMSVAGSQFVDYTSGECSFDSEGFQKFLEFLSRFPEELTEDYYSDEYWNSYDSFWRNGQVLTQQEYFYELRSISYAEQGTFGEPITLIGFPSSDGDGSAIVPVMRLAISSKSNNVDAAWQFVRTYLLEDYQNDTTGFPMSMKVLDKRAQEAMERPYYLNDNGEKEYYDDTYMIGDLEITIEPMTQEEVDKNIEILKSFTNVAKSDSTILNIITEEAEPYFSGQKTAEEVAKIIQNRAQIYLREIQ